jgi:hypothetical protein
MKEPAEEERCAHEPTVPNQWRQNDGSREFHESAGVGGVYAEGVGLTVEGRRSPEEGAADPKRMESKASVPCDFE